MTGDFVLEDEIVRMKNNGHNVSVTISDYTNILKHNNTKATEKYLHADVDILANVSRKVICVKVIYELSG